MAGDDHFRCPVLRLDAQKAELKRQEIRVLLHEVDIGVDSIDEGGDDLFALGMIVIHLLFHVHAGLEKPCPDVPVQSSGSENFCQSACGLTPPDLELEEPVACHVESLSKEKVLLVLGVNMRNPPAVLDDLHRRFESWNEKSFLGGICSGMKKCG